MYYTYVLLCFNNNLTHEFYYGSSSDLRQRIKDHINKKVETTKKFDQIELVYYEACLNKTDSLHREIQLKSGFGRGYIKRRLETYLKSLRV